jgi:3-deoxy-D-manno-octulosonic-acid transferase
MPWLLNLVYLAALGLLSPWLVWRFVRTGRYRKDLFPKLTGRVAPPPRGPVVWFHAVSVGEVHLLGPVVAGFRRRHPHWAVVVSSTTDTGLAEARAKFADHTVVPFPFDFSWAVGAALDRIRPALLVLAEGEMWPNLLRAAHARGVPVAVVNARLSPRSFRRYAKVAGLARRLLFRFVNRIAVQSEDYAERFRSLGVEPSKLAVTGSVKYDGAMGNRDTAKMRDLRRLITPLPLWERGRGEELLSAGSPLTPNPFPPRGEGSLVWVAGSTHAPEEEIVLRTFAALLPRHPTLRLVLVPRHPDRFAEVARLVERSGIPFVCRSQLSEPRADCPPIVLLDTVGELGAAWVLADVGYVGGTLDGKRGGQSMIEPAGYGVPTVFGPHDWNFRDAAARLVEAGGSIRVKTEADLAPALDRLLADEQLRKRMGDAARDLVARQQGATDRTLDVLDELLDEVEARRRAA